MIYYYRPGHLCNRYCGGSHTITTPQQRVTYAKGHCHELLGPKIIPISGCSYMVGTDGKVVIRLCLLNTLPFWYQVDTDV